MLILQRMLKKMVMLPRNLMQMPCDLNSIESTLPTPKARRFL